SGARRGDTGRPGGGERAGGGGRPRATEACPDRGSRRWGTASGGGNCGTQHGGDSGASRNADRQRADPRDLRVLSAAAFWARRGYLNSGANSVSGFAPGFPRTVARTLPSLTT